MSPHAEACWRCARGDRLVDGEHEDPKQPTRDTPEAALAAAYTLLVSVEPTLHRDVRSAPNATSAGYKQLLLDKVAEWIAAYRTALAPREPHKPGDPHQYEILCKVCGWRGTLRLTVDPETWTCSLPPTLDPLA